MKKNIGSTDRIIRFVIAAIVAGLLATSTVVLTSTLGIVLAIVGVLALATASVNWCGLYAVIGTSTCKVD